MTKYGIDVLFETDKYDDIFKGKRIGILTNPTGLSSKFKPTIDILNEKYNVTVLFSPEHGVRGNIEAGDEVEDYIDAKTQLPVKSLYKKNEKHLTKEMLDLFDVFVYDIQDVGSRFYTYITTLLYMMEDCAKANKPIVVLDRPNPLGGVEVEGNIVDEDYISFVGGYSLCMRYGLTYGEFAHMANIEQNIGADLTVVLCEDWTRDMLWCDTGLSWVMPSPAMVNFETALIYSGTCLFEGTNLSEGRGTALPFSLIGAPYIDDPETLAQILNDKNIQGVHYRPLYFTPSSNKHSGELCGGVQFHITDERTIKPVRAAIALLYEVQERYKSSFEWCSLLPTSKRNHIENLGGDDKLLNSEPITEILKQYEDDEKIFLQRKTKYHLYS